MRVSSAEIIYNEDVRAYNTYECPDRICAAKTTVSLPDVTLSPHSIIRVVLEK